MPYGRIPRGFFAMTVTGNKLNETMKGVQKQFDTFFPDNAFEYFQLEEYYNQQYDNDRLLRRIFTFFSFLAILITVLGILGLTSFMILQRTREFSIRAILGARVRQIYRLFTAEFIMLISIGMILSVPICLLSINNWLTSFELRMKLSPWIFIIPFVIAVVTAGVTIAGLVIKVAMANPADNLRYE
jgi:putative ABC transport system permease protein